MLSRLAATVNKCRTASSSRSEEHTSELQSRFELVCRLLLEKKKVPAHEACRRAAATGAHRRQVACRDLLQERTSIDLVRSGTAAQTMRMPVREFDDVARRQV